MPIQSKPETFIYEYNIVIKGTDLLLTLDQTLPSAKDMESFRSLAQDWFSEDLYGYSALLLKNDAEIPANFTLCPIRRFFYEQKELVFITARAKSLLSQRQMYKFCPTCGDRLLDDKTESALFCPSCNIKFFPRIEPATITLISRGDEILLARGKRGTYKKFACISGFVEQGETLEECVAREVKEETNLEVKNIKYMGSTAWPFPDQLMLEFTADYAGGELKIQEDELEEARWFRRDQLPPPEDLPQPGSSAWNLIFGNGHLKNYDFRDDFEF
ncbi:MAG: NAD(+) diphosphatase [Spirochaetales bacterium]|nr:NAD(+) diphosphatase [Spirochaetales bacterium]